MYPSKREWIEKWEYFILHGIWLDSTGVMLHVVIELIMTAHALLTGLGMVR